MVNCVRLGSHTFSMRLPFVNKTSGCYSHPQCLKGNADPLYSGKICIRLKQPINYSVMKNRSVFCFEQD